MSLDVALQSVAFYVLSCSTCAKIKHRRKAKVQAKRERAEKHELETEQPGLYRHPSPFSTNPYWTEEILMGPGPPNKNDKNGSKATSQRALNTGGQGSSYAGSTTMSSDEPSSPSVGTKDMRLSGDGWNRKRYQREDEALWGHDYPGPGQRIMDAIAKAGSSAGRLLESTLSRNAKDPENSPSYYLAKNPPVNDLHPPVVSTAPSSRDETRWMLQPPPSAKVMEGKERVNRSRASSNGSRKAGDTISLSRQITERLVDAKLQRGESPSREEEIRARPTTRSKVRAKRSSSSESSSSNDLLAIRMKRKPAASPMSTSRRIGSRPEPAPAGASTISESIEQPVRPMLSTILSSSTVVPQVKLQDMEASHQNVHSSAPRISGGVSFSELDSEFQGPASSKSPDGGPV